MKEKWLVLKERISQLFSRARQRAQQVDVSSLISKGISKDSTRQLADAITKTMIRVKEKASKIKHPRDWNPQEIANEVTALLQKKNLSFYGTAAVIFLCSYFLADVVTVMVDRFIPDPAPVRPLHRMATGSGGKRQPVFDDYQIILARNLFNSQGKIPGMDQIPGVMDLGGAPVRTSLPFKLVGTLILQDEFRSIATIEDTSAAQVIPVRVQDEIVGKAKILTIESRRVIFINTASGRREFIELPTDNMSNAPRIQLGSPRGMPSGGGAGIDRQGNNFTISNTERDKAFSNFNQILTQARAIPHFENGMPAGFKLIEIVPGSIYEKLGIQNDDVVCGLNGQSVNDVTKALELMGELKTASAVEICVKRGGRQMTFNYNFQ